MATLRFNFDIRNAMRNQERLRRATSSSTRRMEGDINNVTSSVKQLGLAFAGLYLVDKFKEISQSTIEASAQLEKFKTILLGLNQGNEQLTKQNIDYVKLFNIKGAMEGFVKLKSYGIEPTNGAMATLADTSLAMGKSIMDGVEALADALMGENERLKEFGIKGAVQGKQIAYSWVSSSGEAKNIVINNNKEIIESTLLAIWNSKYEGGLKRYSQTYLGLIDTLSAKFKTFQSEFMEQTGLLDLMKDKLKNVTSFLTANKEAFIIKSKIILEGVNLFMTRVKKVVTSVQEAVNSISLSSVLDTAYKDTREGAERIATNLSMISLLFLGRIKAMSLAFVALGRTALLAMMTPIGAITTLSVAVMYLVNNPLSVLKQTWNNILIAFSNGKEVIIRVGNVFATVYSDISNKFSAMLTRIKSLFLWMKESFNDVASYWTNKWEAVTSMFSNSFNYIGNMADNLIKKMGKKWEQFSNWFMTLPIINYFSDTVEKEFSDFKATPLKAIDIKWRYKKVKGEDPKLFKKLTQKKVEIGFTKPSLDALKTAQKGFFSGDFKTEKNSKKGTVTSKALTQLKTFEDAYKKASLSNWQYDIYLINKRYDEYSKYVTNKSKLNEWKELELSKLKLQHLSEFNEAYTRETLTQYEQSKLNLKKEYKSYSKYVKDKVKLDEWRESKLKKIEKEHSEKQLQTEKKKWAELANYRQGLDEELINSFSKNFTNILKGDFSSFNQILSSKVNDFFTIKTTGNVLQNEGYKKVDGNFVKYIDSTKVVIDKSGKILQGSNKVSKDLKDNLKNLNNGISQTLDKLPDGIKTASKNLYDSIGEIGATYQMGNTLNDVFGMNTKAGEYGAIGTAIGAMIPVIGTAIGGGVGILLGSLQGSTEKIKTGFQLASGTITDISGIQSFDKLKSKSLLGTRQWHEIKNLTLKERGTIQNLFDSYSLVLSDVTKGVKQNISILAEETKITNGWGYDKDNSKVSMEELIDRFDISLLTSAFSNGGQLVESWQQYAKGLGKTVLQVFTTAMNKANSMISKLQTNSLISLQSIITSSATKLKSLQDDLGTNINADTYSILFNDVLSRGLSQSELDKWTRLGELIKENRDAQSQYENTLLTRSDTLRNITDSLNGVKNDVINQKNLEQNIKRLEEALNINSRDDLKNLISSSWVKQMTDKDYSNIVKLNELYSQSEPLTNKLNNLLSDWDTTVNKSIESRTKDYSQMLTKILNSNMIDSTIKDSIKYMEYVKAVKNEDYLRAMDYANYNSSFGYNNQIATQNRMLDLANMTPVVTKVSDIENGLKLDELTLKLDSLTSIVTHIQETSEGGL